MLGASRAALADAQDSLARRVADPAVAGQVATLPQELLAVDEVLHREHDLRRALANPGVEPDRKAQLALDVLGGKVSPLAVDTVADLVRARWSADADLLGALELLAAQAGFEAAEQAGRLDAVEEQVFRFGRVVDASPALQLLFTDPRVPGTQKQAVVADLLADKADPLVGQLLGFAVAHPRGRRVDQITAELGELAAQRRGLLVAEVRSAVALTDDQAQRLRTALSRLYGRPVDLQVVVDPAVVGGVEVRVGDERIDGTISGRLDQARRHVLG